MNNMKPTQEQIKEFWEWCGFKFYQPIENGAIDVVYPDDTVCLSPVKLAFPLLDLNNLFKYAVPKLTRYEMFIITGICHVHVNIGSTYEKGDNELPELALFWAIWKLIKRGIYATH
jgi:hypothetical protein